MGTRARSDGFSTKKNRIGQVKKRKRILGKAKKSGTYFLQMLQMLKTIANLGIVEKTKFLTQHGRRWELVQMESEVESNCKNLRNIYIARLAKSMMVYYVLKFAFQKIVERLQNIKIKILICPTKTKPFI